MSTQPEHHAEHQPVVPQSRPPGDIEIRVYNHSTLFYWWPVWALGLVLGILSLVSGERLAIVPKGTEPETVTYEKEEREALVFPSGAKKQKEPIQHVSDNKNYGVLFLSILILVIIVTNVPMRGMWSLVIIITLFLVSIILALAGLWTPIFEKFDQMAIHMNAAGYFYISLVLFGLWLIAILLFDRQMYMIFTPGQFRVCQQIGGGEQVFPTDGMTLERHRSDLFRHWILGLGSGDLTVKTSRGDHFDLHNVLFVGRKVAMIEDMMREKSVVRGH